MSDRPKAMAMTAMGLAGCLTLWAEPPTKLTPRELFYATPAPPPAAKAPAPARQSKSSKPVATPGTAQAPQAPELAAAKPLGLRYSILKYGSGGSAVEVDSDAVFHTGDRIRLRVRVNDPGYLYVAHKGSSGAWQILFPSKEMDGGVNDVSPGREYDVPGSTRLVFDETPGEERLFIILSRQPESQLDRIIYDLDKSTEPLQDKRGKTLVAEARIPDDSIGRFRMTARDLVFEKVDGSRPAPIQAGGKPETAVYVVNASGAKDARLVADVTLKHR